MIKIYPVLFLSCCAIMLSGCTAKGNNVEEKLGGIKDVSSEVPVLSDEGETKTVADGDEQEVPTGKETAGTEKTGTDITGTETAGTEMTDTQTTGTEMAGSKAVTEFVQNFINEFHGEIAGDGNIVLDDYIENENLRAFADKMIEVSQKQAECGMSSVRYGAENEFGEIEIHEICSGIYYANVPFQYEGYGMSCQFLVRAEESEAEILDFYFGYKDGVDSIATGHWTERTVDDPTLWENAEWVESVNGKLADYERKMD